MSTTYTFAGFTFTFNTGDDGKVTEIITPPITVAGIGILAGSVINLNPSATVEDAEARVQQFLAMLGITG